MSRTEQVIADMLTENTGRHMLDSGGAYGRSWERNQGMTLEHFRARPEATIDKWGCVTLDVFHYLTQRVEYDPDIDAAFHEWAQSEEDGRADDPWMYSAQQWAELHNDAHSSVETYNTYNGEDFLSQVLQWVEYEDPEWGGRILLLQIHGGCDVRGGYTAPRAFRLSGYESLWDYADATLHCEGHVTDDRVMPGQVMLDGSVVESVPKVFHSWDLRGGSVDYFREQYRDADDTWHDAREEYGSSVRFDDLETDDDDRPLCPECGSLLHAEAPYPG